MPPLRNPRWELFAQGLADGKRQTDAYKNAGFEYTATKNRSAPARLAKRPEIKARLSELLRERDVVNQQALQIAVKETGVTKAWIMGMLKENVERAMGIKPVLDKDGNPTGEYQYNGFVANKALALLGREIGMFVERHELTLAQRLAEMPEDQRAAEMFDLVERARERLRQLRATEAQVLEGQ